MGVIKKGDVAISKRALKTNIFCGDFIEAAYPFMERSVTINLCAYLAGGIATEIIYRSPHQVLSSAYLPVFLSLFLAEDHKRMFHACMISFFMPFIGTLCFNYYSYYTSNDYSKKK